MGAAASVNGTDWDSLDVPVSDLTAEIKALSKEAEELKQAIAQDDFFQLRKALAKKFKPHTEIIRRITARTKSQINRLSTMGEGAVLKEVFKLSEKYGNFIKCCQKPCSQVSTILLRTACSGIGCDHAILVSVICSSTPGELAALDKDLAAVLGMDNLKKVAIGNARDHLLKKFFELALNDLERKDSAEYIANNGIAKDEAAKLHGYFTEKNDANNAEILSLLVGASRAHTMQIAESFKTLTEKDLDTAIGEYFEPEALVTRALLAWIAPVPRAVARMLFEFGKKISYNDSAFELIYGVISRHDKPMLAAVGKEYLAISGGSTVSDLTHAAMKGKLAQAVDLWCSSEHTTPDGGVEEELVQYLATKAFHDGTDCDVNIGQMANLVKDAATASEIKEILEREVANLKGFKKANVQEEETAEWTEAEPEEALSPEQEAGFDDARALISAYLKVLFAYYDKDMSGTLDNDEFWRMVDEINLSEFGFSDEDIIAMKEVSDWDNDGKGIAYDEVINELSGHMFKSCVKQGFNVEELMKDRIAAHAAAVKGDGDKEAASVDPSAIRENKLHAGPKKMPPHIETWIHQTFNTYDVDKSGELDVDEFLKCISAMNLGTTEDDLERIRKDMDTNGDAKISWAEAIEPFTDIILSMTSDTRDHWIGLVDAESGFLFWYNLKDGNSIWMNAEDQAAYRAQQISGPSQKCRNDAATSKTEAQQAISLGALNKTSIYEDEDQQDKLAKLRKSEAKANELLRDSLGTKQDIQKKALQERLAKKKKTNKFSLT